MSTGRCGAASLLAGAALLLAACSTTTADPVASDVDPTRSAGAAESAESAGATVVPVVPARPAAANLVPEAPRSATLPSGTVVSIRPATTTRSGRLAVPQDPGIAGWWRGGSRLGDPFGSTLVAAHVDSTTRGLGPFAELLSVGRGDRVVLESKHLTQVFEVDSLRLVPQGPLTGERRLFAATGPHRLTLVTCAPPYDRDRGGYQNLAVVTAIPRGEPRSSS